MRWILGITLALALMAGPASAADGYIVQPEDVLAVNVYGHDDLSRDVVVLNDGSVTYPIAGRIMVSGKSLEQVAGIVSKALRSELNQPQVTVSVKQPAIRRVYVSGLVKQAGSHDLKAGWRISHLIAEAGGIDGKAELAKAILIRGKDTIPIDLTRVISSNDREADLLLIPGDLLQVQADTNLVHVAGQVKTPGDYQVKSKLGIVEAVAMAGGPTAEAALTRAQIIRQSQVIKVNLHELMVEGKTAGNVELMPGDTLVIPRNEARIAVLGGVQNPGYFDLPDGKNVTVADAIGMARGANKHAKLDKVSLVRTVDGQNQIASIDVGKFLKKGDGTQNPLVKPGDVVFVPDGSGVEKGQKLSAFTSLLSPLLFGVLF